MNKAVADMELGNVIVYDGRVGIVSEIFSNISGEWDLVPKSFRGIYLNGEKFDIDLDKHWILLDETPNDYINRHVAKFGKLKVSSRGKKSV